MITIIIIIIIIYNNNKNYNNKYHIFNYVVIIILIIIFIIIKKMKKILEEEDDCEKIELQRMYWCLRKKVDSILKYYKLYQKYMIEDFIIQFAYSYLSTLI